MVMWGVGKDEMKGKHSPFTTCTCSTSAIGLLDCASKFETAANDRA